MSNNEALGFDYDNLEDELYCDCEEIKKPKKKKKKQISNFEKLKSHFDIVEFAEFGNYNLFTCKNYVDHAFIEYEVWLNIKCKKKYSSEKIAEYIYQYVDKLFNSPESTQVQISLFDDPSEPLDKTKVENLTFWECFEDSCLYDWDDYLHEIPATNEEMIAFAKKCIKLYVKNPHAKYDFFSFEDEYSYLTREPISDRELLSRLYGRLRIKFGVSKYVSDSYSIDLSNRVFRFEHKGKTYARFTTGYYAHQLQLSFDLNTYRVYDLYDKDFCNWVRKKLNIPYREPITDKEIIKKQMLSYSKCFFKNEKTLYELINNCKNGKEFKQKVVRKLKEQPDSTGHMGGGGGPLDDTYSYSYGYDLNHLKLSVTQLNTYREQLGRKIIPHDNHINKEETYILNLEGHEVFTEMYKILSNQPVYKQQSLFD